MSDENSNIEDVPEAPAPVAPEQPAEAPAPEAAPEAVPVVAAVPSNQNEPPAAPEAAKEPPPLKDAVEVVLVYVKAGRTAGDSDLAAAIEDVEASIAAQA